MSDEKPKIIMSPLAQRQLDELLLNGTPEQIADAQAALDRIKAVVESGEMDPEVFEPVDMDRLRQDDPDLYNTLIQSFTEARFMMGEDPNLPQAIEFFKDAERTADEEVSGHFGQVREWLEDLLELRAEIGRLRERNEVLTDHYEAKMRGSERATRLEARVEAAESEVVRLRDVVRAHCPAEEFPTCDDCADYDGVKCTDPQPDDGRTMHERTSKPCNRGVRYIVKE